MLRLERILTIKGFPLRHCTAILWHCFKIFNGVNFLIIPAHIPGSR